jgi:homoserine dehydrogenase
MRDKGLSFDDVLKEAQRLGYAEADPTFDIEGVDAAHKATLIASIAFGIPVQFDKAYVEGITKLEASDIKYAEQLGYRIKLLGIAKRARASSCACTDPDPGQAPDRQRRRRDERRLVRAMPSAPRSTTARGRRRADRFRRDRRPGRRHPPGHRRCRPPRAAPGLPAGCHVHLPILPMSEIETSYYLRLRVEDKPGVLADITRILADQGSPSMPCCSASRKRARRDRHHHPDPCVRKALPMRQSPRSKAWQPRRARSSAFAWKSCSRAKADVVF